jgi:hypothetical protein
MVSRWRETEIFHTRPDRPWGPPSLLYNGYRVPFPRVKQPGRGVVHPPPCSAEVKERVELYIYSAPWIIMASLVLRLTFTLPRVMRVYTLVYTRVYFKLTVTGNSLPHIAESGYLYSPWFIATLFSRTYVIGCP